MPSKLASVTLLPIYAPSRHPSIIAPTTMPLVSARFRAGPSANAVAATIKVKDTAVAVEALFIFEIMS
jgi:hypothetical protein